MGVKIERKKRRLFWLSAINRLHKILPLPKKTKLKMYLNLTWIFERLSHETSFSYYNTENHPVRLLPKRFIYKYMDRGFTVLDLGCSAGQISHVLAERVKKVVGIDYDKQAIDKAKMSYKRDNLEFYHGEAFEFLANNRDHFDLLFLSHILEHLDNPKEFLLKFKDFFDYIYVELPDFDRYFLNHYRKDLKLQLIYTDDDHVSEFDRYELRDLLAECGIEILDSVYIYGDQQLWCRVKK